MSGAAGLGLGFLPQGTVAGDKPNTYDATQVKATITANPTPKSSVFQMVKPVAGALLAGAFAGSFMTGESFQDVAFAMNGALGAAVGIAAAPYVAPKVPRKMLAVLPVGLAIGVPALVGMKLDGPVVAIGVSSAAGAYAAVAFGK